MNAFRSKAIRARWTGPVIIALVTTIMCWWSWGTWPDVLIDFGAQLYLPWQIVAGKRLYADLDHFKGPLSHYLNALWFRLFGVSLWTLVFCNLVILVGIIYLLYRILLEISDRFSATIACLVFVTLFAFGQFVGIGNYNFVCPYAHEVTHGLTLSLVSIFSLSVYHRRRRLVSIACSGLSLGAVFLTDAPVFLAACLAMTLGVGLTIWLEHPMRRRLVQLLGTIVGSTLILPALTFALLCFTMPAAQALRGFLGSWPWILGKGIIFMPFYRWGMGTHDVGESLHAMFFWTWRYATIFVPVAWLSLATGRSRRHRIQLIAVCCLLFVGLCGWLRRIQWLEALRPLSLVTLFFGTASWMTLLRHRQDPHTNTQAVLRLTMIVFAFALLGKIILNTRLYHYGFALAMPATLLLVVALVGWIPRFIEGHGRCGEIFRAASLTILLVAVMAHLQMMGFWFSRKTYRVSTGPDAFLADERGLAVNAALKEISKRCGTGQTLTVLPEGVMLNYLARRASPLSSNTFLPFIVFFRGEKSQLIELQSKSPDYVVLVHKDTSEEGFRFFGRDYAQQLYAWIRTHYHDVQVIGAYPLQDDRFGIALLKRTELP